MTASVSTLGSTVVEERVEDGRAFKAWNVEGEKQWTEPPPSRTDKWAMKLAETGAIFVSSLPTALKLQQCSQEVRAQVPSTAKN